VATACGSYGLDFTNKVRRALTIGGPTFIHSIEPCPKGWDFDPKYAHELGMLAVETGLWVQYEIIDGELTLNGASRAIARGNRKRKPVKEYLVRQGRFAHLTPEDIELFQRKVDETWEKWWIPGVIPFKKEEG
jgi:pyruvate ferredoxin oxidoreductase beta subunit